MKTLLTLFFFTISFIMSKAQGVSIGNTSPNSSAVLDLSNPQHKGLLIPSMTTAQKNSIVSPANGLMIFQTDSTKGFYFYDGMHWKQIGGGGNAWMENDEDVYTNKNAGIGTDDPDNAFETHGNMVITAPTITTDTAPTTAQTKLMSPLPGSSFSIADSTGRIYDPGGPAGDYPANMGGNNLNFYCTISSFGSSIGIELKIETLGIGPGDSLIFKGDNDIVLLMLGSGSTSIGKYVFNTKGMVIRLSSNGDGMPGSGCSLLFKRLFVSPHQDNVSNFSGNTLYFDAKDGSLASGTHLLNAAINGSSVFGFHNVAIGYSAAFGAESKSTGSHSLASGFTSIASGDQSVAFGNHCNATGEYSVAAGIHSEANGISSVALGHYCTANQYSFSSGDSNDATGNASASLGSNNIASGSYSFATGNLNTASGNYSFTTGNFNSANGTTSTSLGKSTVSNGVSCLAIGRYNDPLVDPQTGESELTSSTPLFIVGNGVSGNPSNAMLVRYDGHVGIGTNTPRVKLHVTNGTDAGLNDDDGYIVIGSVGNSNIVLDDNEIMARNNAVVSDLFLQHNGGKILVGAGGTDHLFDVNGTAGKPGGGVWATYSDSRLKQNIESYTDGLEVVMKIHPVSYHYNNISGFDTLPKYVGVIAQELKQIAPYMVSTSNKVLIDGSTGYLEVDNSAMIYMLINAIKELNAKIEMLEKQGQSENQ